MKVKNWKSIVSAVPVRSELNSECTNALIGDYSNALYRRLDNINMSNQK